MKKVQGILACVVLAAIGSVLVEVVLLVRAAKDVVSDTPAQVAATRAALVGEIAAARTDLDRQITELCIRTLAEVAAGRKAADQRIGNSLERVDKALEIADARLGAAQGSIEGLRADVAPVLKHTDALIVDTQASWDDSYYDVRGLLDSAEVATTQVAQTAEVIAKAAPEATQAAIANENNVAGITADIHTITVAATKPKSFWGKIWAGITVASKFAGLL